jgi:hypothetical protein
LGAKKSAAAEAAAMLVEKMPPAQNVNRTAI